jgi:hypothetical protein
LRQPGLVVTSGHDRRHAIRGISKTIRASEIYLSPCIYGTFGANGDVNSHGLGVTSAAVSVLPHRLLVVRFDPYRQLLTGADEVRVDADGHLVADVQRAPSAAEVKGVGDGPEAVAGADDIGAVRRLA